LIAWNSSFDREACVIMDEINGIIYAHALRLEVYKPSQR